MFDIVGPLMPQVTAGNVKALGLAAKEQIPAAPGVKTIIEQGVPDFVSGTWAGIIAPAGTPKEIVDRVAAEAKKALADPGHEGKARRAGDRGGRQHAGRIPGLRGGGDRPLGQGDQGREHQDGGVGLLSSRPSNATHCASRDHNHRIYPYRELRLDPLVARPG